MQIKEFCSKCGEVKEFIVISMSETTDGYKSVTLQCIDCGATINKTMML